MGILAYAERTDTSGEWGIVLVCIVILGGTALLAMVPIRLARVRRLRFAEAIIAGTIAWGALSAGSGIFSLLAQSHYASEHYKLMMTGYLDPNDDSAAPAWPWGLWGGLVIGYGFLVGVSVVGKGRGAPGDSLPGDQPPSG